jgi:hypothetical protein
LEPYRELILEMRRRGRSYREIARVLQQSCDLRVGSSTINDFVLTAAKSRSRKKSAVKNTISITNKDSLVLTGTYKNRKDIQGHISTYRAPEGIARNIKELKDQPPLHRKKKAVFEYNPEEPLRLQRNQKTKE